MIRKIAATLLTTALLGALPLQAAQLGGLLGGNKSSSDTNAAVPDLAAQEALVRQFIAAKLPEINAQIEFSKAFGLAEQAQALEAQQQALSSGSTDQAALKKASEVGANAQKQIDAKQAEKPALDAAAKEHYSEGLVSLVLASLEAKKLTDAAQTFGEGLKAAKGTEALTLANKLSAGVYVSKETPGYTKGLYDSTKSALTFARANNIKVPANVDALPF